MEIEYAPDMPCFAIAQRFCEAVAARDLAVLGSVFAEDAVIWHNTDGQSQTKIQALAAIGQFFSSVAECRYANVRQTPTPLGLVQQHDLHLRFQPGGRTIRVPACLVFQMANGQVSRLEEYLDPAALSGG